MKNPILKLGCVAVAITAIAALTSASFAAETKTAKGGAGELMKLKPIKTADDVVGLKAGDSVVMACPKCKTVYVTKITKENKPGKTGTVGAAGSWLPRLRHETDPRRPRQNRKRRDHARLPELRF